MQIGELARKAGVSVRALRHYEAQGLLHSTRLANGFRSYAATSSETVEQIRLLLSCGFSTRQIGTFLPCLGEPNAFDPDACSAGLEQHRAKLREIDDLIAILRERRCRLAARIRQFGVPSDAVSNGVTADDAA